MASASRLAKCVQQRTRAGRWSSATANGAGEAEAYGARPRPRYTIDNRWENRSVSAVARDHDKAVATRLHRSIIDNAEDEPRHADEYLRRSEDVSPVVEFEDPNDFIHNITATPDDFEFEHRGPKLSVMVPVDNADASKIDKEFKHPAHKLVGRRVRKVVEKQRERRGRQTRVHHVEGIVTRYNEKKATFQIKYHDDKVEHVDLVTLKQILIMDRKYGDPDEHHGRTLEEVNAAECQHVVCAEIWEQYLSNRIPVAYGEGEETARILSESPEVQADVRASEVAPAQVAQSEARAHVQTRLKACLRADLKPTRKQVRFACTDGVARKTDDADSKSVVVSQIKSVEGYERGAIDEPTIKQNRKRRNRERRDGFYEDKAFFEPSMIFEPSMMSPQAGKLDGKTLQAAASSSEAEIEPEMEFDEVPRDDEPRNKREAENHRCVRCRGSRKHEQPCERCLEERKGIFDCWKKEVSQLVDKGVWRELSESEISKIKAEGHRILNAKMVTKRKYEAVRGKDGMVRDRFLKWKGRLACVGTSEVKGVDMPWSTFSPVIGLTAVRTVMSLMCRKDFDVNAYDLSGAFLAADLDRPVYMTLPAECGELAGKHVQLSKAIYGLKTSSRDYVKAFSDKVLEFEHEGCKFERLHMDACIFRFRGKNGEEIILCHYVDDLIIGSNSIQVREKLLKHIREKWDVTDEGPMTRFVGLNFGRSEDGLRWDLSCAPYIERVASRFGVDDGKLSDTPMDAGFVVTPEDLEEKATPEMLTEYRSLIGSIGFAATTVRYDIAYAVSVLSRYIMRPNAKVIEAAKRVIRYLLKTRDFKITWSTQKGDIAPERINRIWGAVDASFASDPVTRRSHSGFLIFNNGGAISWKSGLQKMVTLSSCESEYVGLCGAVVELCYLRQLMGELGHPQEKGTVLWEDNKACIILAEGETSSGGRSKHVDVKFRFIAENVRNGVVSVRYIPTAWNYADIMTKPLGKIQFARILDLCMAPEVNGLRDSGEESGLEEEVANFTFISGEEC